MLYGYFHHETRTPIDPADSQLAILFCCSKTNRKSQEDGDSLSGSGLKVTSSVDARIIRPQSELDVGVRDRSVVEGLEAMAEATTSPFQGWGLARTRCPDQ